MEYIVIMSPGGIVAIIVAIIVSWIIIGFPIVIISIRYLPITPFYTHIYDVIYNLFIVSALLHIYLDNKFNFYHDMIYPNAPHYIGIHHN